MNKETLRTRTTAAIFALSIVISFIFLGFAFIQKSEAEIQTQIAVQSRVEAEHHRAIAEQFRMEAEHQGVIAAQSMIQAEKARQISKRVPVDNLPH